MIQSINNVSKYEYDASLHAMLCFIGLLSLIVMGISELPIAGVISVFALLSVLNALRKLRKMPIVPLLCFVFMLYILSSGLMFGGIYSFKLNGLVAWIGNEGRVFLYFWPFLFVTLAVNFKENSFYVKIHKFIRLVTIAYFIDIVVRNITGYQSFSSHHAAGAIGACILIYNLFSFDIHRKRDNAFYLVISAVGILGSNSRTSLIAVFVSVILVYMFRRRFLEIALLLFVSFFLWILMLAVFPNESTRIQGLGENEVGDVSRNFVLGINDDRSLPIARAYQLSEYIKNSGDLNLGIRGYLWGNALAKGIRSPFVGIGFGRYNDNLKSYYEIPYILYATRDASMPSSSILTAHNTFIHNFVELGIIGLVILYLIYGKLFKDIRKFRPVSLEGEKWKYVGLASLLCLFFMGFTQHSIGAPIYGMSLMLFVGIAYSYVTHLGLESK